MVDAPPFPGIARSRKPPPEQFAINSGSRGRSSTVLQSSRVRLRNTLTEMASTKRVYWPFPVLPVWEQTDLGKREIRFLEEAYAADYHPYVFDGENFGLGEQQARWVEFVYRGRQHGEPRWEPLLLEGQQHYRNGPLFNCSESAAVFVVGIERLRQVAFRWLAGTSPDHVYDEIPVVIPERERMTR